MALASIRARMSVPPPATKGTTFLLHLIVLRGIARPYFGPLFSSGPHPIDRSGARRHHPLSLCQFAGRARPALPATGRLAPVKQGTVRRGRMSCFLNLTERTKRLEVQNFTVANVC